MDYFGFEDYVGYNYAWYFQPYYKLIQYNDQLVKKQKYKVLIVYKTDALLYCI